MKYFKIPLLATISRLQVCSIINLLPPHLPSLLFAGPYKDRAKLIAAYKAGTLDPNQASTSAAATAAAQVRRQRPGAAPRAAPSNPATAPAFIPAEDELDEAVYESEDNSVSILLCRWINLSLSSSLLSLKTNFFPILFLNFQDDDYESEYDSEEDAEFHLCNMDLCYDLLPNEDEMGISEWLQSQVGRQTHLK